MTEAVLRSELPESAPPAYERYQGPYESEQLPGRVSDRPAPAFPSGQQGALQVRRFYSGTGTLIGWGAIAQYMGISLPSAMRWERLQRLPVCRLPDGRVMTTLSLIDQWVMARIDAQKAERGA